MAIHIQNDSPDSLELKIDNGDLRALHEIIKTWGFKDNVSVLQFAIAVLKITEPESLVKSEHGDISPLLPTAKLLSTEYNNDPTNE